MTKRSVYAIAGVLAVAGSLAGCSSSEAPTPPAGALAPGTAEIAIDGAQVESTHSVKCTSDGAVITLDTGEDDSGTTSSVDTSEEPKLQFAELRDVDGFTGSYWDQLGPQGDADVSGRTFTIKGTATGFADDNPSARVSRAFSIKVAC